MRQNPLNSVAHIDFISYSYSLPGHVFFFSVPDPEQQRCNQMKMICVYGLPLIWLPMFKQRCLVRKTTRKDDDHNNETNDGKVPYQRDNQDISDSFYL